MDAVTVIRCGGPPEKTVPLCLAGPLVADYEQLCQDLAEAERAGSTSLAGNPEKFRIANEIAAMEEMMAEHVVQVRLRALPRKRWAALVAEHPARTDEAGAAVDVNGYNADTFVAAALRECVVDPVLDDDMWELLIDERLSDGQYETLTNALWDLNRSTVNVPFSRAASRIRQASATG